jgi:hypothetical protein
MNCEQAQEAILLAEDPAHPQDAELGRHVMGCAVCGMFADRLAGLERAAAQLPMPASSEQAKQSVIANVRSKLMAPRRQLFLRPAWIGAVAASLVIAIGLSAWLWPREAPASVVEQLIDWDVALADAQAPQEREQLYTNQAATLRTAVQRASLNDEDRQLATTLLENAAWLSRNNDPVERTEKFCDLADLLVVRMNSAAAANDSRTMQRLGGHYGRVQRGIGANLERIGAVASIAPDRKKRLERIERRREEALRRIQMLSEKSPKQAQRALKRMLENAKRQQARRGN